jgi:hypothetical protein
LILSIELENSPNLLFVDTSTVKLRGHTITLGGRNSGLHSDTLCAIFSNLGQFLLPDQHLPLMQVLSSLSLSGTDRAELAFSVAAVDSCRLCMIQRYQVACLTNHFLPFTWFGSEPASFIPSLVSFEESIILPEGLLQMCPMGECGYVFMFYPLTCTH